MRQRLEMNESSFCNLFLKLNVKSFGFLPSVHSDCQCVFQERSSKCVTCPKDFWWDKYRHILRLEYPLVTSNFVPTHEEHMWSSHIKLEFAHFNWYSNRKMWRYFSHRNCFRRIKAPSSYISSICILLTRSFFRTGEQRQRRNSKSEGRLWHANWSRKRSYSSSSSPAALGSSAGLVRLLLNSWNIKVGAETSKKRSCLHHLKWGRNCCRNSSISPINFPLRKH